MSKTIITKELFFISLREFQDLYVIEKKNSLQLFVCFLCPVVHILLIWRPTLGRLVVGLGYTDFSHLTNTII